MKTYNEIVLEIKTINDEYSETLMDLKERLNKAHNDISHFKGMTDEEFKMEKSNLTKTNMSMKGGLKE